VWEKKKRKKSPAILCDPFWDGCVNARTQRLKQSPPLFFSILYQVSRKLVLSSSDLQLGPEKRSLWITWIVLIFLIPTFGSAGASAVKATEVPGPNRSKLIRSSRSSRRPPRIPQPLRQTRHALVAFYHPSSEIWVNSTRKCSHGSRWKKI